jgi:hypothetical protein
MFATVPRATGDPWSVFLKAHWRSLVAADFLTVEVWKPRGLISVLRAVLH